MKWIASQLKVGKEYEIRRKIKSLIPQAEVLVPRLYEKEIKGGIIRTRSERLLPGYLLIGTPEVLNRDKIKGLVKIVGSVSQEEVDRIMAQEGSKSEVLADGIGVLIIDGPFQGCRGKIIKQNEDKTMNCRIMFQGMELFADLDTKLLSSISSKVEI